MLLSSARRLCVTLLRTVILANRFNVSPETFYVEYHSEISSTYDHGLGRNGHRLFGLVVYAFYSVSPCTAETAAKGYKPN